MLENPNYHSSEDEGPREIKHGKDDDGTSKFGKFLP
jgi:hypothetical protein